jgi:hypothetical protein
MKIPEHILNKFDKESEGIEWGEIIIKVTFQKRKPVFFLDKHTSEKYAADNASTVNGITD